MRRALLTEDAIARIECTFSQIASGRVDSNHMAKKRGLIANRVAHAPAHAPLADNFVHVFVDDQNLFWGITNDIYGKGYRMDFGRLLLETARGADGMARGVKTVIRRAKLTP